MISTPPASLESSHLLAREVAEQFVKSLKELQDVEAIIADQSTTAERKAEAEARHVELQRVLAALFPLVLEVLPIMDEAVHICENQIHYGLWGFTPQQPSKAATVTREEQEVALRRLQEMRNEVSAAVERSIAAGEPADEQFKKKQALFQFDLWIAKGKATLAKNAPPDKPQTANNQVAAKPVVRSDLKVAIRIYLEKNPGANYLVLAQGVDELGTVELFDDWRTADNKQASWAYAVKHHQNLARKFRTIVSKAK
jgi:hypothetical protein